MRDLICDIKISVRQALLQEKLSVYDHIVIKKPDKEKRWISTRFFTS